MKLGVPTFGYENFGQFAQRLATQGHYTVNVGDSMQSVAIRLALERLGIAPEDIVAVNRDTLATYDGPSVALVMNGLFYDWCFPTPPAVKPIFIGLCVQEGTVQRFREYFARHQPIGCRDADTRDRFVRHGIAAYTSGCLTLTLPPRAAPAAADKVLLVHGTLAGAFPAAVLRHVPPQLLDAAEFVFHRLPAFEHPLSAPRRAEVECYARALLDRYATTARLVVTPLHHAATPCMALGIPTIVCRNRFDSRFSFLRELTAIHMPQDFEHIDWNPAPVDVDAVRRRLRGALEEAIRLL